jgi:translation initiation factor IF-1
MTKEDLVRMDGQVIEVLPGGMFKVNINEHILLAYTSGNMKKNKIKIIQDDRVSVEMSPYDLDRGRIVFRYR